MDSKQLAEGLQEFRNRLATIYGSSVGFSTRFIVADVMWEARISIHDRDISESSKHKNLEKAIDNTLEKIEMEIEGQ